MSQTLNVGSRIIRLSLFVAALIAFAGLLSAGHLMNALPDPALHGTARFIFTVLLLNALLLVMVLWMLATRGLVKKVNILAAAINRGAEGDLTARVEMNSGDEIAHLAANFNVMLVRLSEMVNGVRRSINELRQISLDNSTVSRMVVTAAEKKSEAVKETSAAVMAINGSVEVVTDEVEGLSNSSQENAASMLEMAECIEEVRQTVSTQAQAIGEVSASITEMAAAQKQIAFSVNSLMDVSSATASSVAEMDTSINQVEKNALETASISENVLRDAQTGRESVEATSFGIGQIRNSSRVTFDSIQSLSRRAEDIGAILSVIDDVAEQTNLLALNAAIIASQAGEHGKGFAVVADEIKELAERTSTSTREIADLIKKVQEETRQAVDAISQVEQRVMEGEKLSERSGEALKKIVDGVSMSHQRVSEIARTTVEQSRGSQMIRDAIEHVSDMVSQIAGSTREQEMTSESIMAAVGRMKGFTVQVRTATRRQKQVGEVIGVSTEKMTEMVRQIREACREQALWSAQIVSAVEAMQHSTTTDLESARLMDGGVESLVRQIELLQKQIALLRVQ